jgi:peptidoglycan/xylan/chitin deacetylase (PgdA/CDA1 family)
MPDTPDTTNASDTPETGWPGGCRAAVSLTYDDALPVHYQRVAPLLEEAGLRATFYTPLRGRLLEAADHWRELAAAGHELGNHTIFHPCRRDVPGGRPWLNEAFDLAAYNLHRFEQELAVANGVLRLIDGRDRRSFGNTCHDTHVGPAHQPLSIAPVIERLFVAGRGPGRPEPIDPRTADLAALGTRNADGRSFAELRDELDAVVDAGGWIIYTLHGLGPRTHRFHIDPGEHAKLVDHLAARRETIHTAPVADLAEHLRSRKM